MEDEQARSRYWQVERWKCELELSFVVPRGAAADVNNLYGELRRIFAGVGFLEWKQDAEQLGIYLQQFRAGDDEYQRSNNGGHLVCANHESRREAIQPCDVHRDGAETNADCDADSNAVRGRHSPNPDESWPRLARGEGEKVVDSSATAFTRHLSLSRRSSRCRASIRG